MWLDELVRARREGRILGLPSVCSAHPWVLRAVMLHAREREYPLLIESTCNQVNQYGGYTGMRPADFVAYVYRLAEATGLPRERLLLGGDHLGPYVWRHLPSEKAMEEAAVLVREYVRAGYRKIHLDCSMPLADDGPELSPETVARRTAFLARVAEAAYEETGRAGPAPRYVVGTEVPPPGGARGRDAVTPTPPEEVRETLELMEQAFRQAGLEEAWTRVVALVVQPGVEFGDDFVHIYRPEAARALSTLLREWPIVYEAHSTDYQTPQALAALVRDGFAILKVGPALTFAFREAVFALAAMEGYLVPPEERSWLLEVLEEVMLENPRHWQGYYQGTPREQAWKRRFSFSDRIRYYWPHPRVQAALDRLLRNLQGRELPLALLRAFFARQFERLQAGQLAATPQALILDAIQQVWHPYIVAARGSEASPQQEEPGNGTPFR